MSEQVLLQGKLLGVEEFLSLPTDNHRFLARCQWLALLSEVLPRALLAELELNRLLLGSAGGGQFLIIIPDEAKAAAADQFLAVEAARVSQASAGSIRLIWSRTENLGDWTVVRKRLNDALHAQESAPLASGRSFEPFVPSPAQTNDGLDREFSEKFRSAAKAGWSPDSPRIVEFDSPKYAWDITQDLGVDGMVMARHAARRRDGQTVASTSDLARQAAGFSIWGVLRADVDNFGIRVRRAQTIEEHVQLSIMYRNFFARELDILCSMGDFWQRVSVIATGNDSFAVYGAWDALILLARELQRTFSRFVEENLKEFPGLEGKTISMAIAAAPAGGTALPELYDQAGRNLTVAKSVDKDCVFLLDRVLEWKQLGDAIEVKEMVSRIASEFRAGKQFLSELERLYQKASAPEALADPERLVRRAYRFQRKYSRISSQREREFARLKTHLISEIVGRNVKPAPGKQLKLRPAGVVALEWARLAQEV